ncbi:DUF427 domain-containing protein [Amycolatopsis alkalitolerans]|uniref:DUF427 domain-containing protein n=1 Tax=Amycolatopsis alkalitolerans TaxID=2547244 RepID=A0A5C4M7R9_9PSEU|nr:DUF427 domain-containing protein [Amycolatopsis alkalitolerans]TNC27759.1 DUF427 domain-containing protein [Amycolatopsis alkalitolerans]
MTREIRIPDATHPITVEPTVGRVVVKAGGRIIAESTAALTLRESTYPPVQYIPLSDVDPAVLEPSDAKTYCPYKGEASYYSLSVPGQEAPNAVWTYETPYDAVSDIASHVAFYPDKVEITVTE